MVAAAHDDEPTNGKKCGRARNAPKFDLLTPLFRMFERMDKPKSVAAAH